MLDRYIATEDGGSGMVAMLQRLRIWYGVSSMKLQWKWKGKQKSSVPNFVYGLEADVNYEDENASAIAFLDKDTI